MRYAKLGGVFTPKRRKVRVETNAASSACSSSSSSSSSSNVAQTNNLAALRRRRHICQSYEDYKEKQKRRQGATTKQQQKQYQQCLCCFSYCSCNSQSSSSSSSMCSSSTCTFCLSFRLIQAAAIQLALMGKSVESAAKEIYYFLNKIICFDQSIWLCRAYVLQSNNSPKGLLFKHRSYSNQRRHGMEALWTGDSHPVIGLSFTHGSMEPWRPSGQAIATK